MARSNQHAQKKSSKVNGKHDGKSKGRSRFKRGGDAKASAPSAAAGEEVPARKLSSSKLSTTTRNLRFMQRGNVKDGGGAEDSNLASHPDRWVLPAASTAHTASAAAANDAESAGVARRTVEVVSGFSAFESIMETRRSYVHVELSTVHINLSRSAVPFYQHHRLDRSFTRPSIYHGAL